VTKYTFIKNIRLLLYIRKFILERNPMNVTNVGGPLVDIQTLQYVREFILIFGHRNDHVNTQREGGHLQARERVSSERINSGTLILDF